jgi:hypothetical protein
MWLPILGTAVCVSVVVNVNCGDFEINLPSWQLAEVFGRVSCKFGGVNFTASTEQVHYVAKDFLRNEGRLI